MQMPRFKTVTPKSVLKLIIKPNVSQNELNQICFFKLMQLNFTDFENQTARRGCSFKRSDPEQGCIQQFH
jgi:hypothetical protein